MTVAWLPRESSRLQQSTAGNDSPPDEEQLFHQEYGKTETLAANTRDDTV
jgi:hypothetical protein